jgi:hypothetical protein
MNSLIEIDCPRCDSLILDECEIVAFAPVECVCSSCREIVTVFELDSGLLGFTKKESEFVFRHGVTNKNINYVLHERIEVERKAKDEEKRERRFELLNDIKEVFGFIKRGVSA